MKQKLGLACTLVRSPQLLLLDEPTVGVDPLSRRELWEIVLRLVRDEGLSVVVTTSYLDEAEHCDQAVVMHAGRVLAQGRLGGDHRESRMAASSSPRRLPACQPARFRRGCSSVRNVVDAVPEAGKVGSFGHWTHPGSALVVDGRRIPTEPIRPRLRTASWSCSAPSRASKCGTS